MSDEEFLKTTQIHFVLANGELYDQVGKFHFINRQVDSSTGPILIEAMFPNPNRMLKPGAQGMVKIKARDYKNAMLIPQRCVIEIQDLRQVAIIDKAGKVKIQNVQLAEKIGSFWVVKSGLKSEDQVVYEGLQKIKDGQVAKFKSIEGPKFEQAPLK